MNGLDVLDRVQRTVEQGFRDLRRQRPQNQDPGDPRVGIELANDRQRIGLDGIAGQCLTHVVAVDLIS